MMALTFPKIKHKKIFEFILGTENGPAFSLMTTRDRAFCHNKFQKNFLVEILAAFKEIYEPYKLRQLKIRDVTDTPEREDFFFYLFI